MTNGCHKGEPMGTATSKRPATKPEPKAETPKVTTAEKKPAQGK
jgi:hypothetical protein